MRLTVEEAARRGWLGEIEVTVDGKPVKKCFEADEEAGYALCYKVDEKGQVVLERDPETGEKWPAISHLEGRVRIRLSLGVSQLLKSLSPVA